MDLFGRNRKNITEGEDSTAADVQPAEPTPATEKLSSLNRYVVSCFNETSVGRSEYIHVRVIASSENEAVTKALQICSRQAGTVVEIEELNNDIRQTNTIEKNL